LVPRSRPARKRKRKRDGGGPPMGFANQVAIITGASSGIGWSLARILAAQGCKVGLVARRQGKLLQLPQAIRPAGGTAAFAAGHVGDREQTLAAIHGVASELGPVDLLIANAGVGMPTLLPPMNVADIEAMFRVNTLGVVYALEAVLPEMLRRGRGHVAAVSSLPADQGMPASSTHDARQP